MVVVVVRSCIRVIWDQLTEDWVFSPSYEYLFEFHANYISVHPPPRELNLYRKVTLMTTKFALSLLDIASKWIVQRGWPLGTASPPRPQSARVLTFLASLDISCFVSDRHVICFIFGLVRRGWSSWKRGGHWILDSDIVWSYAFLFVKTLEHLGHIRELCNKGVFEFDVDYETSSKELLSLLLIFFDHVSFDQKNTKEMKRKEKKK